MIAAGTDGETANGEVDLELSREVYDLALAVWRLAPWTFMDETDLFGVEEPRSKELGFVSVMGALGQHRAVAVYQGVKGLYEFLSLERASGDLSPSRFLDMPQVQLSFEKRSALEREDRVLLQRLGLPALGDDAWPLIRTYRAACMPWFATDDELRLLAAALSQLIEMAPRIERDVTCLRPASGTGVLIRARSGTGTAAGWSESFVTINPPEPEHISVRIDPDLIDDVRELPDADAVLEVECFRTESVIAERGKRPYFPYVLLICDAKSGLVLHVDLIDPTPSMTDMWAGTPERVACQLTKLGWIPREIRVREGILAQLMELIAPGFGFNVVRAARLPSLDRAKNSLLQNFGAPQPAARAKKPARKRAPRATAPRRA